MLATVFVFIWNVLHKKRQRTEKNTNDLKKKRPNLQNFLVLQNNPSAVLDGR